MSDFDDQDPLSQFIDPDFDGGLPNDDHHDFDQKAVDEMARVLVKEETGVKFDSLALFAEPLFSAYDLDFTEAFTLKASTREADAEVVTLLEAARLLWAYFSLTGDKRAKSHDALKAHLSGHDAGEEDEVDLDHLVDVMQPYWSTMSEEEIREAENTEAETLSLEDLLAHKVLQHDSGVIAKGYGTDGLNEIEARAIFTQPLLEELGVLGDVERFEFAVERANQYWLLAEMPEADRDHVFKDVLRSLSQDPAELVALEMEARQMIGRYFELFPERA